MHLGVRLLRKMLRDLGVVEGDVLDKDTLARRVMAARILRQRQRQKVRKSTIKSTSNWHQHSCNSSSAAKPRQPQASATRCEQRDTAVGTADTTRKSSRQRARVEQDAAEHAPAAAPGGAVAEHREDDPESIAAARERLRRFEQLRMIEELQVMDRDIASNTAAPARGNLVSEDGGAESQTEVVADGADGQAQQAQGNVAQALGEASVRVEVDSEASSPRYATQRNVVRGCTAGKCRVS